MLVPKRAPTTATAAIAAAVTKQVVKKLRIKPAAVARRAAIPLPPPGSMSSRAMENPISECVIKYATVLSNPWAAAGTNPCIPSRAMPSFRLQTTVRSSFIVGTLGAGGVAVWPFRLCVNDTPEVTAGYSASACVTTTVDYDQVDARFANTDSVAAAEGRWINRAAAQALFTVADLGNQTGRAVRLVGSGIRLVGTSSLTDQKGSITLFRNPIPDKVIGSNNDELSEMLGTIDASRISVRQAGENWTGVPFRPFPGDTEYVTEPGITWWNASSSSSIRSLINYRCAYLAFVSGATPGTEFNFEVINFYEITGRGLPVIRAESDETGVSLVQASVSTGPMEPFPEHNHRALLAQMASSAIGMATGSVSPQQMLSTIGTAGLHMAAHTKRGREMGDRVRRLKAMLEGSSLSN